LRTSVAFNESEVLREFRVTTTSDQCSPLTVEVFYNDEHALTLGVRQVQVITSSGTTTTNYPISPLTADPDSATNPLVGSQIQSGDQAGVDTSDRPMFPALFITDTTFGGNPLAGDWQYGGTGIPPTFVSGTWKGAIRIIDHVKNTITVTPDMDPPVNNWVLGPGADPVPTPTPTNQGYGAEIRWDISQLGLLAGHTYRLYFMIHDGDQNKTGGDSGQGCAFITMPGGPPPASPTPTATASPTPTATATATPAITVTNRAFSAKTVTITFTNNTSSAQVLNALQMTWPQATNGNLTKVTMGATTIFNTSTGGGNFISFSLSGTTAQRTIAANGGTATLTFTFQNNVNTNANNYTGTATFNPFGAVSYLP
jgi:hypothetical protein